jgi:glycosyltransferase involved in cell wall biosynthesis
MKDFKMQRKLISIIIPVYNEEINIPIIHKEIENVFADLKDKFNYEVIFIDDGSTDKGLIVLESLANRYKNCKFIQFSRNFGKEIALTAGLKMSTGDAVITLDADLQHPGVSCGLQILTSGVCD